MKEKISFFLIFIENFIIKNKKYIDYFLFLIIFCTWLFLLYNGNITIIRLINFFLILLIGYTYTRILNLQSKYLENWVEKFKIKNEKLLITINNFLIVVNIIKNPFLFILYYIDIFFFNFFKNLNYKFLNYKNLRYWLTLIILSVTLNPIKLIIELYYQLILRWRKMSFSNLLSKRLEGLVLSILIFTNILNIILEKASELGYINIYLYVYVFIVLVSGFFQYIGIERYKFNTAILIDLNKNLTILGNIIRVSTKVIRGSVLNKYRIKLIYEYYFTIYDLNESIELEWNKKKHFLISKVNLMINEIKNKPNIYIYQLLYKSLVRPGLNILHWKYYKDKNFLIKFNTQENETINYLYNYDLLKIKLLLFLIWDFESYMGFTDYNNIIISKDFNLYYLYLNTELFNIDNINTFDIINKSNFEFFDIDKNFIFWNKWYDLVESYLMIFKSNLNDENYMKAYFEIFDNCRFNYNCGRNIELNIDEIEEDLKIWIDTLIYNFREEWKFILLEKKKDGVYWTLLNELEKINKNK